MDYSIFYERIKADFWEYFYACFFIAFLSLVISVILIICFLKSKNKSELFCGIILFIGFIFAVSRLSILFPDISNIRNETFILTVGIVVGHDTTDNNRPTSRSIKLKENETEKIIKLSVHYTNIYINDMLEVIYLPNSGIGAIIRIIE